LLGAPDGQIARRVAQPFLLLVSGIVLLVDHDDGQLRQRREYREPRAEHDPRTAAVRRKPVARPFALRETAVQGDDRSAVERRETCAKRSLELRREIDFGDEDERLSIGPRRENGGERTQIDLGLAAAGHAVQQEGSEAVSVADRLDGGGLFVGESRQGGRDGLLRAVAH